MKKETSYQKLKRIISEMEIKQNNLFIIISNAKTLEEIKEYYYKQLDPLKSRLTIWGKVYFSIKQ